MQAFWIKIPTPLLNRILVQPNSAEFVIAEVSKGNVEELAKLDIVRDIDLWDDTIEVTSEDDPDELYRNAFVEWSVSKYGKNCLADGYSYKELYRHVADNQTDWVLVTRNTYCPHPKPRLGCVSAAETFFPVLFALRSSAATAFMM